MSAATNSTTSCKPALIRWVLLWGSNRSSKKWWAATWLKNLLTILPQKRLDEVKQAFAAAGYSAGQIDQAFDPASYRGHPVLASLPAGASLEGYLYPDSFEKQADTPAIDIVRESLDEMQKYLTQDVINGFGTHSLNVYQGITLASIVAQETDDPTYQPNSCPSLFVTPSGQHGAWF